MIVLNGTLASSCHKFSLYDVITNKDGRKGTVNWETPDPEKGIEITDEHGIIGTWKPADVKEVKRKEE